MTGERQARVYWARYNKVGLLQEIYTDEGVGRSYCSGHDYIVPVIEKFGFDRVKADLICSQAHVKKLEAMRDKIKDQLDWGSGREVLFHAHQVMDQVEVALEYIPAGQAWGLERSYLNFRAIYPKQKPEAKSYGTKPGKL